MILCVLGGVMDEADREEGTQEGRKAKTRGLGSQTPPKAFGFDASSQYWRKLCVMECNSVK